MYIAEVLLVRGACIGPVFRPFLFSDILMIMTMKLKEIAIAVSAQDKMNKTNLCLKM